jgi:two-component system alkaline phosphatase synthesis response regulator PhoP
MRQKPLILIVDDDPEFASILVGKLTSRGFEVATATNGKEGFEKANAVRPDLILMDVKMPTMDGVEAVMKIKADPILKQTKVVFLTAFGENQPEVYQNDQRFASELGADGYLLKDEDLENMVQKIRGFLGIPS